MKLAWLSISYKSKKTAAVIGVGTGELGGLQPPTPQIVSSPDRFFPFLFVVAEKGSGGSP